MDYAEIAEQLDTGKNLSLIHISRHRMKSKTILGADGATKMRQITVGIHGKGGEAGIKAIQQLAGMVDSLKPVSYTHLTDTHAKYMAIIQQGNYSRKR